MIWDTPDTEMRVTVAQLIERRVSLRWHEAVAIVLEVADVFRRSLTRAVPFRDGLALTAEGTIEFGRDGRQTADPVTALADTLAALLPLLPKDPPTQLQLIASTAGPDSVSYKSVDEFTEALGFFERPGRRRILGEVYQRGLETGPDRWGEPLPSAGPTESQGAPIRMLPTRDIVSHETVQTDEIRQLVESVRQFGVLQPLLVRRFGSGYELVAGAKRFAAARVAGLTELPCRISEVDPSRRLEPAMVPAVSVESPGGRDERRPDVVAEPPRPAVERVEHAGHADHAEHSEHVDDTRAGRGATADPRVAPDLVLGPALGEIADSLRAATSCWRLSVEGPERPYARTVNEVTRAELQRATWVVEALQLLTQRPVVTKSRVNLGTVLEQVFRATEPERRLAEVKLSANLSEASVVVRGDEGLLLMAVGGVVQALVALVSDVAPATIQCTVGPRAGGAAVELAQDAVAVSPSLVERFFEETWHGRPGGYGSAIALAAAKRVFELHGGSAKVESDLRGCRVTLTLPT